MIQTLGLGKRYGATQALAGLDLEVAPGACCALLGANGSGKSTAIQMLGTLITPSQGSARIAGHDLCSQAVQVRSVTGLVLQEPALDGGMTVIENLRFAGALQDVPRAVADRRSEELLALFALQGVRDARVATLSGGMRRGVDIVRGLLHRPAVLLLDEPTTGLDPVNRSALWRYLQRMRRESGTTLVVATHLLDEVADCDDTLFLRAGCVIGRGRPGALIAALGSWILDLSGDAAALEPFLHLGVARHTATGISLRIADPALTLSSLDAAAVLRLETITQRRPRLEDVYLDLMAGTQTP